MTTPEEELRMPFWSHLAELRKRLVISAMAISAGFVVCFNYSEDLLGILMMPLNSTMSYQASFPFLLFTPNPVKQELFFTTLTEPFMAHLKIAFVAALILAVPIILLQIWKFISPGLMPRERRYTGYFVSFSTLFFAAGVLFCFLLLLPYAVPFLIGYKTEHLKPIIRIGEYIDFTLKFLLGAGAVFELPLIIILLSRMGILQPASLAKFRKYAFLLSFIIGAIITPTPDAFNMTLMSLPIYVLYEIGILGARIFGRKRGSDSTDLAET
jgi:sec-independent protein translocase protein TatC